MKLLTCVLMPHGSKTDEINLFVVVHFHSQIDWTSSLLFFSFDTEVPCLV